MCVMHKMVNAITFSLLKLWAVGSTKFDCGSWSKSSRSCVYNTKKHIHTNTKRRETQTKQIKKNYLYTQNRYEKHKREVSKWIHSWINQTVEKAKRQIEGHTVRQTKRKLDSWIDKEKIRQLDEQREN